VFDHDGASVRFLLSTEIFKGGVEDVRSMAPVIRHYQGLAVLMRETTPADMEFSKFFEGVGGGTAHGPHYDSCSPDFWPHIGWNCMPHGADNIEIFHLLLNKVYVGGPATSPIPVGASRL